MSDNIQKLEKLVDKLPDLSAIVRNLMGPHVEYDVGDGLCVGFGLFNNERVAVQRTAMSKGTVFPRHKHEAKEVIIVTFGKLKVRCDGMEKELQVGDVFYFPHGQDHSIEALEDTWMIALTIPSAKGYPHAG